MLYDIQKHYSLLKLFLYVFVALIYLASESYLGNIRQQKMRKIVVFNLTKTCNNGFFLAII